jgi:hypothetical protein
MIYKLNGLPFDITAGHLIGDVNYPGNWFQDAKNRVAMGITEEADPPTPAPTQAEITQNLENAVQEFIHKKAQERNWDTIYTATLRAAYIGPWQAEGLKYAQWMDKCWEYAFKVESDCQAGLRTIPTAAELIAELPVLVVP